MNRDFEESQRGISAIAQRLGECVAMAALHATSQQEVHRLHERSVADHSYENHIYGTIWPI